MTQSRKYRNPPVVEALCELFFEGSNWDEAVPGQFYERVKKRFPEKAQREAQQAHVAMSSTGEATAGVRRLPPRLQFLTPDRNRMIQLEQDLLVVNQLPPYPHFEDWQPEISSALEAYRKLTSPTGVKRLGIRYINRIVIPHSPIDLEDYYTVYPNLPRDMGNVLEGFLVRFEIPRQNENHTVLVTLAAAPAEKPGEVSQLLDLYDVYQPSEPIALSDVDHHVLAAHKNVQAAFEGSITEQLRKLFAPED
ncbi:MAG TPA: TIGR04255 family protein [candidate division Zixibacteria bacterium]|jgi:uncharacterized protein (TIGR04255 family)